MPKTILQRMDDCIRWTGIPKQVEAALRPGNAARPLRQSRWLPLVLFVIATGLVIRYATDTALLMSVDPIESVIRTFGFMFPGLVPAATYFGPLGPRARSVRMDEWEAALVHRAIFFSLILVGALQMLGIPLLIAIAFIRVWSSDVILIELGLWSVYLCVLFQLIATLHASWSMPPAINGEDEVSLR